MIAINVHLAKIFPVIGTNDDDCVLIHTQIRQQVKKASHILISHQYAVSRIELCEPHKIRRGAGGNKAANQDSAQTHSTTG